MNEQRIPNTDSIDELARFWDTHDLTDFDSQLEEVSEPVFERKSSMNVPLEPDEIEAVERLARSLGIPSADLVRRWVREKIGAS